ncbi:hypothetical protein C8Q74DRAFT_1001880 [Fomes fomentarius]|nr:hypothetical protein C8Q74DRAFT_1001880 [Fomes fomentarius]
MPSFAPHTPPPTRPLRSALRNGRNGGFRTDLSNSVPDTTAAVVPLTRDVTNTPAPLPTRATAAPTTTRATAPPTRPLRSILRNGNSSALRISTPALATTTLSLTSDVTNTPAAFPTAAPTRPLRSILRNGNSSTLRISTPSHPTTTVSLTSGTDHTPGSQSSAEPATHVDAPPLATDARVSVYSPPPSPPIPPPPPPTPVVRFAREPRGTAKRRAKRTLQALKFNGVLRPHKNKTRDREHRVGDGAPLATSWPPRNHWCVDPTALWDAEDPDTWAWRAAPTQVDDSTRRGRQTPSETSYVLP